MIPKDYYFSRAERSREVYLHGVRVGRVHEIAVFDYWDILSYADLNWAVEEVLSKKAGWMDDDIGFIDVLKESEVYQYCRQAEVALVERVLEEFTEEEIKTLGAQQEEREEDEKRNLSRFKRAIEFVRR